jgi:hypothetical protein
MQEAEIGKYAAPSQFGGGGGRKKNFWETHLNGKKTGTLESIYHHNYSGRHKIGLWSSPAWENSKTLFLK